jgi:hypothetical protein
LGIILDNFISYQLNIDPMEISSKKPVAALLRRSPVFRALSVVVLVVSLGIEVLSCSFVESVAPVSAERSGRPVCPEPLLVCDNHDSFGVLFDVPALLPWAPCLVTSPAERRSLQQAGDFAPDGFHGAIDHPPQFRS